MRAQITTAGLILTAAFIAAGPACAKEVPKRTDAAQDQDVYQFRTATRDGIGKYYMGREISHVMGHLGAGWLERPTREREERTDLLLENLPLEPGAVAADTAPTSPGKSARSACSGKCARCRRVSSLALPSSEDRGDAAASRISTTSVHHEN